MCSRSSCTCWSTRACCSCFFYSTFVEWVDRKLYAKFQNRMGADVTPAAMELLQPISPTFSQVMAKEDIVPDKSDRRAVQHGAGAGVGLGADRRATAAGYGTSRSRSSRPPRSRATFIVMAYLLSLPTFAYFLAGWSSTSMYAAIGGFGLLTLLFRLRGGRCSWRSCPRR